MDIKNTVITAQMVIQSLLVLLENENVDISSVKFKVGQEGDKTQGHEFELSKMIHLATSGLEEIKQNNGVPEGCIIAPKLSANYLFSKVPELGFLHQDEKDTVLYHLNYMACGFNDSAYQFVVNDHEVQKQLIEDEANTKNRTDFEIINQTITLVDLLASSTSRFQRDQERCKYPFESENPRVKEWWCTACRIQELLTDTDPENCDFEEYKAMIEAVEDKSL